MSGKAKRYWWLKLREDFFEQKEMKKLRKVAGGDTYTIIYLKMQLLNLRNDGVILFERVEDSFEQKLALELDESLDDIKMTMLFLETHGLIEAISDTEHMLPEMVKSIGSESDSAERMRNLRQKRLDNPPQCDSPKITLSHCDGEPKEIFSLVSQSDAKSVTCDTEKEREKELRGEI